MAKSNALELSIRIAGKVDSSLTKAIKTAQSQTSGLARGMSGFAKVSAAAIAGVTTATAGIMGYCGKQAAGLEKAMAQTRTLLTGTTEQTAARTAELTQGVMNISRITGRVSTEIAAGSYQVISAFQDTADTCMTLGNTEILLESVNAEEAEEICECLKVLYSTRAGELGLDRDFGISMDAIDKPLSVAKAMIAAEIVRKTKKYEPRVEVARVEWDDAKAGEGILIPKVVLQVV